MQKPTLRSVSHCTKTLNLFFVKWNTLSINFQPQFFLFSLKKKNLWLIFLNHSKTWLWNWKHTSTSLCRGVWTRNWVEYRLFGRKSPEKPITAPKKWFLEQKPRLRNVSRYAKAFSSIIGKRNNPSSEFEPQNFFF